MKNTDYSANRREHRACQRRDYNAAMWYKIDHDFRLGVRRYDLLMAAVRSGHRAPLMVDYGTSARRLW